MPSIEIPIPIYKKNGRITFSIIRIIAFWQIDVNFKTIINNAGVKNTRSIVETLWREFGVFFIMTWIDAKIRYCNPQNDAYQDSYLHPIHEIAKQWYF